MCPRITMLINHRLRLCCPTIPMIKTYSEQRGRFRGPSARRLLSTKPSSIERLWPARPNFVLMCPSKTEKYKIHTAQAMLQVCKITLTPTLSLAHANMLAESPAIYPYERTDIKTFNITKGSLNFRADDVYQGAIPSRLIIGIVNAEGLQW